MVSVFCTPTLPLLWALSKKHGRHKWIANTPESTVVISKPQPKGGIVSIFKRTVALRGSSFKKYETKLRSGHQNVLGVFVLAKIVILTWTEYPRNGTTVSTRADPERPHQPHQELDLSAHNKTAPHSSTQFFQFQIEVSLSEHANG